VTVSIFILLDAAKLPDIMSPVLSACAFILSLGAFIFTVFIQSKERTRNIRQTLSSSLSEIASINIAVTKLQKDEKEASAELVRMIKNYNSQRGTLISAADFLMQQNEKTITGPDYQLMALTYDDLEDIPKAEEYWGKAIENASGPPQKHLFQRDYAAFLFNNNREEDGRKYFEESLKVNLSSTDDEYRYLVDTYVTWATLEKNFGNDNEFDRLIKEAYSQCKKIRHHEKNAQMCNLVDKLAKVA
jgi:tetratricopeptide (TPR) repeat protein